MQRWLIWSVAIVVLSLAAETRAQNYDANWIWLDAGDPATEAPVGTVWFRHQLAASEPSTGAARVVCDDDFVLWVNGTRVGEGEGQKLYRFNLNGIVGRGQNVIAIEAKNQGGKAGLFVDGEIRGQSGRGIAFDTGADWVATTEAPEGDAWLKPDFSTDGFTAVKVIGPHADSPWKAMVLKDSYLDRYSLAQGFEIERVAEPELVGSIVAITWGNRGRLIASRERGPILSVIDDNGDGTYDRVVEYSNEVKNCQGLCMVFDDLYAVGDGPQGTGMYRLPDKNGDDVADEVQHIVKHKGNMGEHGPHDVVFGPDGWLYHNMGNHAWIIDEPQPETAVRGSYEGDLLRPKFEDARGHARGIKVPGGSIWRFTPDGKQWWCETAGFRNEYDIAFNRKGDLFTFDSDMEWDVGMPWYRPVRINHCIPGAEFGWRSGAAKWPAYYFDSLPSAVDIGRGSPTGVVFYEHDQFPEEFQGAFLVCDWSMGRIITVKLDPQGASYTGEFENLVTGNPLNVSDIEVATDGSVIFSTGGRNTEGGIYRVTAYGAESNPASAETVADLLKLPQISSAWARELAANVKAKVGKAWAGELEAAARDGSPTEQIQALTLMSQLEPKPSTELLVELTKDDDSQVRAFATFLIGDRSEAKNLRLVLSPLLADESPMVQRRACEAFVRSGTAAPVSGLLELLKSSDRWVRFAARIALERILADKWQEQALASHNPHVVTNAMLALRRSAPDAFTPDQAVEIVAQLLRNGRGGLTQTALLDTLRILELALIDGAQGPQVDKLGQQLLGVFPTGDEPTDNELVRLLAVMQVPGAAEKIVQALEKAPTPGEQIHYALALRYLDAGWNLDTKRRLLDWYEQTRGWEGGHSMIPYLANIVGASLEKHTPAERKQLLTEWPQRPFASGLLIRNSQPGDVEDYVQVVGAILNDAREQDSPGREELVATAIEALGKSEDPEARSALHHFYDKNPDRREQIARAVADKPRGEDWELLVETLRFGDPTTLQLALSALGKLKQKPEKPEPYRLAILAGLKLSDERSKLATKLLDKWTGNQTEVGGSLEEALQGYQSWFATNYPDSPPAELPQADPNQTKYTFEQLVEFLENDPHGQQGDVQRGSKVFAKAKCAKCHRFLKEGEIVGPDLTSVRRRFQRKEIIESIVHPSQVISDQYRMETIVTDAGLIHNGMPIPSASDRDKVVLLLSDATKIEIPKDEVEETHKSKISVMPEGLLKDLTLEEIADLFAFLETSKFNPETPRDVTAAGSGSD